MERTTIDLWFGAFVAAGFAALLVLALKVGNLGAERATQTYRVEARFDNIGGLKVRGPVRSAGVLVGAWPTSTSTTSATRRASRSRSTSATPSRKDTTASILTSGLLGENYVGLEPAATTRSSPKATASHHAVGGGAGEADRPVPVQQGAGRAGARRRK
jgi:phospholipid/cholesterol/gamma-HCH transport system substrate-binding protein